jgi:hypothetical protein
VSAGRATDSTIAGLTVRTWTGAGRAAKIALRSPAHCQECDLRRYGRALQTAALATFHRRNAWGCLPSCKHVARMPSGVARCACMQHGCNGTRCSRRRRANPSEAASHCTALHCGVRAYWRRSALLGAAALQCAVGGLTFGVPREVDKHVRAVRADLCGRVGVCTYADSRNRLVS